MDDQLTIGILLAVLSLLTLSACFLRLRKTKKNETRRVERFSARTERPFSKTRVRTEEKPFYSVRRPGIFLWREHGAEEALPALFIQRAQSNDENHYRECFADRATLERYDGLLSRAGALLCEPGDGLSPNVFSLNFSQDFLKAPEMAEGKDYAQEALCEKGIGIRLGSQADCVPGRLIAELHALFGSVSAESELEKILKRESALFEIHFAKASLLIDPECLPLWEERVTQWKELMRNAFTDAGETRFEGMEEILSLEILSGEIDAKIDSLSLTIKSAAAADEAITASLRLIAEKETLLRLQILYLLLLIVRGGGYLSGLKALKGLRRMFESFPRIERFLLKAEEYGFGRIEKEGRTLSAEDIELLNTLCRDAGELRKVHAATLAHLGSRVEEITALAEDELIHGGLAHRYAVRTDANGRIAALLMLHRY